MLEAFSLADEICRTSCNDADKGAFLIVFERQILFGDAGKSFIQFLFRLLVFLRLFRGILVDADVMPALEIVRKTVLLFGHVQAESLTGFEIVEIGIGVGVLL